MTAIVNADQNWAIGLKGQLLYNIPEDMKFFKQTTTGHVVIMGSGTLSSFPGQRPLKDRVNIVLSRRQGFAPEGFIVCHTNEELKALLSNYTDKEVFLIGGQNVYTQMIDYCDKAYVTRVQAGKEADAFFPNLDKMDNWTLENCLPKSRHEDLEFSICTYKNNRVAAL